MLLRPLFFRGILLLVSMASGNEQVPFTSFILLRFLPRRIAVALCIISRIPSLPSIGLEGTMMRDLLSPWLYLPSPCNRDWY